jgi:photosystem II stability/assembly factor-like uncharacterized protein
MVDSRDSKLFTLPVTGTRRPGGFFKSTDGGATWKEAKNLKRINSFDDAIFRRPECIVSRHDRRRLDFKNSGDDWEKNTISTMPINVGSLAIDPRNLDTIYAGTWWRAYKSTDSGKNWRLIKDGMIDDSDVFAITINKANPDHIVASACSGIYESLIKAKNGRKFREFRRNRAARAIFCSIRPNPERFTRRRPKVFG